MNCREGEVRSPLQFLQVNLAIWMNADWTWNISGVGLGKHEVTQIISVPLDGPAGTGIERPCGHRGSALAGRGQMNGLIEIVKMKGHPETGDLKILTIHCSQPVRAGSSVWLVGGEGGRFYVS
jgi:hypothetical protein